MKAISKLSFPSCLFLIVVFTFNTGFTNQEVKPNGGSIITMTDIDGNVYKTVKIGSQIWIIENLRTTKYNDGTKIPNIANNTEWSQYTNGAYCNYDNSESNAIKYGRLYNFYAVNTGKLAPAGWHVAKYTDWIVLENYLIANGYNFDGTKEKNKIAKSIAATTNWNADTYTGAIGNDLKKNNKTGFSALPGGGRAFNGEFNGIGEIGFWWSPTEVGYNSWGRSLSYNSYALDRGTREKRFGFSVRCIKDETSNNIKIETVLIPAGTFTMGSPENEVNRNANETQHQVSLSAFRMSKYEITNAQYAAFLNIRGIGSNGLYAAGTYPRQPLIFASSGNKGKLGLHLNGEQWVCTTGYENYPVINVTWYGATEYASYVGGKLPSEAQWEYACRAGSTTPFNTGECLTNKQANYRWDYPYNNCVNNITTPLSEAKPIGTYAPNAFGLYDMHGNVEEWCADKYGNYPNDTETNPTGATTGSARVVRGGNWGTGGAQFCRSASRNYYDSYSAYNYIGFRIVFVP